MPEFYLDERPKPTKPPQWDGGDANSNNNWGVNWGSGGGSGGDAGGDSGNDDLWHLVSSWGYSQTQVLLNGEGYIQMCDNYALKGDRGCMDLVVEAQINGDSSGAHTRCVLLGFTMTDRTGAADNPFDWLFGNVPVINGTMTIRAKWQAGHWDYSLIHTVRFKLFAENEEDAVITPWVKLPLGSPYVDIAVIDVVHGQLVLNSLRLV